MTEQTGFSILAFILERLGTAPLLLFFTIIFVGPWVTQIWLEHKRDKRLAKIFERQDKQFGDVVQMYKDNVILCERYDVHSTEQQKITANLQDLVILTTTTMQSLVDYIKGSVRP